MMTSQSSNHARLPSPAASQPNARNPSHNARKSLKSIVLSRRSNPPPIHLPVSRLTCTPSDLHANADPTEPRLVAVAQGLLVERLLCLAGADGMSIAASISISWGPDATCAKRWCGARRRDRQERYYLQGGKGREEGGLSECDVRGRDRRVRGRVCGGLDVG